MKIDKVIRKRWNFSKKNIKTKITKNGLWKKMAWKHDRNNFFECWEQTIQTFLELWVCYTYAMLMLYSTGRMRSGGSWTCWQEQPLDGHEKPQGWLTSARAISFATPWGGSPGHSLSPSSDDERDTAENKAQNKRFIDLRSKKRSNQFHRVVRASSLDANCDFFPPQIYNDLRHSYIERTIVVALIFGPFQ